MAGFSRNSWSDPQRRLACRLAFAALVALPALLVARRLFTPPDPVRLLAPLAEIAGLNATVERIKTPRPDSMALDGLRISLPDGGSLELPGTHWNRGAREEVSIIDTIRMDAASLTSLLAGAAQSIRPAGADCQGEVGFLLRCDRVELEGVTGADGSSQPLVLAPLELAVVRSATSCRCLAILHQAGSDSGPLAEIVFERQALAGGNTTSWLRISTGDHQLPAGLFAGLAPQLKQLGNHARLSGEWSCHSNDNEPGGGSCQGWLTGVDLAVLGRTLGRKLSGTGSLGIDRLEWTAGRIERLQATVAADHGQFGSGWESFQDRSGWLPGPSASGGKFDHLQFRLIVEQGQVQVFPRPENGGTIIAWTERGDEAWCVLESNPAGRVCSLPEFAASLFAVPGHSGSGTPGLGDPAIAFLNRFRVDAEDQTLPDNPVHVAAEHSGAPVSR